MARVQKIELKFERNDVGDVVVHKKFEDQEYVAFQNDMKRFKEWLHCAIENTLKIYLTDDLMKDPGEATIEMKLTR